MLEFTNPFAKKEQITKQDKPIYVKKDGTKVYEKIDDAGNTMVWQMQPNGVFIMHSYDANKNIICDLVRKVNYQIGHEYNELKQIVHEFNHLFDEKNEKLIKQIEIFFTYHDNGNMSSKIEINITTQVKTIFYYNEKGELNEKIIERGTVKTFYDKDDKPFKREIDRGSGGIITEDL